MSTGGQQPETYSYYLLLPEKQGGEPRVLLVQEGDAWTLPHFSTERLHYWQEVSHINSAAHELLGIEVTTLRCLSVGRDPATGRATRLYLLENHTPGFSPPPGARWASAAEISELGPPVAALERWVGQGQASPLRKRWMVPGWYSEALEWVRVQVEAEGARITARPEQIRAWERSFVMRVPTTRGDLYFKAVPPMFAHEVPLTRALGAWYPGYFPDVAASDDAQGWMLVRDFGGTRLDKVRDLTRWEDALRTLARLQIDLASRADELLALGCPYRGLDVLAGQVGPFLLDDSSWRVLGTVPMTESERAQLRELLPNIMSAIEELDRFNIPPSLEHGDLWSEQVIDRGHAGYLYSDWSDSSLAHPFFSAAMFLGDTGIEIPGGPEAPGLLEKAYLTPWTNFEPPERLARAFSLALKLAPLHFALTTHLVVLPGLEEKWEMENMVPFYLRLALQAFGAPAS